MSGKVIDFPGKPCTANDLDWIRDQVDAGEVVSYAVAVVWANGEVGTTVETGEQPVLLTAAIGRLVHRVQEEWE